jgi:hypothetical protein
MVVKFTTRLPPQAVRALYSSQHVLLRTPSIGEVGESYLPRAGVVLDTPVEFVGVEIGESADQIGVRGPTWKQESGIGRRSNRGDKVAPGSEGRATKAV